MRMNVYFSLQVLKTRMLLSVLEQFPIKIRNVKCKVRTLFSYSTILFYCNLFIYANNHSFIALFPFFVSFYSFHDLLLFLHKAHFIFQSLFSTKQRLCIAPFAYKKATIYFKNKVSQFSGSYIVEDFTLLLYRFQ